MRSVDNGERSSVRHLDAHEGGGSAEQTGRREFLISKTWIQAVVLVVLVGFFVLGLLAYRTYMAHPPVPERVVDAHGHTLFTGNDISQGQKVFLNNGLMEYGSVFGHGAYLGPDYTADYLHRSALFVRDAYGGPASDAAATRTVEDLRANRYDSNTRTLRLSAAEAAAFRHLVPHYSNFFSDPTSEHGLTPDAITNPTQLLRDRDGPDGRGGGDPPRDARHLAS